MNIKIVLFLSLGLLLAGCQYQTQRKAVHFPWTLYSPAMEEEMVKPVRAAVLLPLSGKSAGVGQAFRNSCMMALQERPNSPLELIFFDTKGTAEGTVLSWKEAKREDLDIVIGPVFAAEVTALKEQSPNVPVISFTTDHSVLEEDVYSMGVLIPNQVERLVEFMCAAGQKKIAVLGPENKTGELTMNKLSETVQRCPDMKIEKVSLYPPETTDFTQAVLKVVPKPIDIEIQKEGLSEEEQAALETPMADRLGFDSLFIFEDGVKLQQVVPLLAYYDVTPDVVPFYGPATWQAAQNKGLKGSYFTAIPPDRPNQFESRYRRIFGEKPPRIASLGYDAVSLVALLSEKGSLTQDYLTQKEGFNGVNGRFRLNEDGTNDRLLEIFQIQSTTRSTVVSPEAVDFMDKNTPFTAPEPEETQEDKPEEVNTENSEEIPLSSAG